jgi:hypothetical protein
VQIEINGDFFDSAEAVEILIALKDVQDDSVITTGSLSFWLLP